MSDLDFSLIDAWKQIRTGNLKKIFHKLENISKSNHEIEFLKCVTLFRLGEYYKAIVNCEHLVNQNPNKDILIEAFSLQALCALRAGLTHAAETYIQRSLDEISNSSTLQSVSSVMTLYCQGFLAWMKSDYTNAMNYYKQIKEIIQTVPSSDETHYYKIRYLMGYTIVYLGTSDYVNALNKSNEVINLLDLKEDYYFRGLTYLNKGIIFTQLKDVNNSLQAFNQALSIFRKIDASKLQAAAIGNIAEISLIEGNLDKAINLFKEAIELDLDNSRNMALNYQGLGLIYSNIEEHQTSLTYFDKAIAIRTSIENKNDLGESLLSRGRNFVALGRLDEAYLDFAECKKINENANEKMVSEALFHLIYICGMKGRFIELNNAILMLTSLPRTNHNQVNLLLSKIVNILYNNEIQDGSKVIEYLEEVIGLDISISKTLIALLIKLNLMIQRLNKKNMEFHLQEINFIINYIKQSISSKSFISLHIHILLLELRLSYLQKEDLKIISTIEKLVHADALTQIRNYSKLQIKLLQSKSEQITDTMDLQEKIKILGISEELQYIIPIKHEFL